MIELDPNYLNKIANQLIVISSLLSGFSIAVMANLLISDTKNRLSNTILKITTIAAASFLITVFAMTKIVMMTTQGYPFRVVDSDLTWPKITGFLSFFIGVITLLILIALSGWTKSRKTGVFTTIIAIITVIMIFLSL